MINSSTSLYGVFGNPIGHSLSPLMHNRAFAETGFNGIYMPFRVEDIGAAVSGVRAMGIKGMSITIPHKTEIIDFLDTVDDTAKKIGAVNTVINDNGILSGYNSDYPGALRALKEKAVIKNSDVAIIGAGGAARAIGYGIMEEGGRVTIFNRTIQKGERLAGDLNADFKPLDEEKRIDCRILINTTPVGMAPHTDTMPIKSELIEKDMLVMDIIYNPMATRLLKVAKDIGCGIIDGVSMFVYQGAFQFELWTGQKAPVALMKKTVTEALSSHTVI